MTVFGNKFLWLYKLENGYLGIVSFGNKEYQFGLMTSKPRWFALSKKISNGEYKTLIAKGGHYDR